MAISGGLDAAPHSVQAWRVANSPRELPFSVASFSGIDSGGAMWRAADSRGTSHALLYVSPTCPHCHAELRRWEAIGKMQPALLAGLQLVVIVPASIPSSLRDFLPRTLRIRVVIDADRKLARSLRVRAVPHVAFVDRELMARSTSIGQINRYRTMANLRTVER